MREVSAGEISRTVAGLCAKAGCDLPDDVLAALKKAKSLEESPQGRNILDELVENAQVAKAEMLPLCQDTGLALVFVDLGQEVIISGGGLDEAVNAGIRQGYAEAFLRNSVVFHPLHDRRNTGDNTPAIIHLRHTSGDRIEIVLSPKGGGCENKSCLSMLTPADGETGVKRVFHDAVLAAGAGACPPFVIGVGIGGTSELAMLNAKRALLRRIDAHPPNARHARLEAELLEIANATGIGPQGFGGRVTALKVNVEFAPAHIASLPVAVSISCHAARHARALI